MEAIDPIAPCHRGVESPISPKVFNVNRKQGGENMPPLGSAAGRCVVSMIIKSLCFGINVSFRSQSRGGVGEDFRQTRAIKKVRPKRPDFSLKNKFNLLLFFHCFSSLLPAVFGFLCRRRFFFCSQGASRV